MQNQYAFDRRLCVYGLPERPYGQLGGDVFVGNARNHTAVMQIKDGTVITLAAVFQEQVCEIRTPFGIDLIA